MSQTNIGPRIGVDGEEEYRKQINNIIQQAKTLDAQMAAVAASFAKDATAQERAAASAQILTRQTANAEERLQLLREMVEKSTAATGENSKETLKWKEALYNAEAAANRLHQQNAEVTATLNGMTTEMQETERESSRFADVLKANLTADLIKDGLKALAEGIVDVGKAMVNMGVDVVQSFGELEQNLGGSEAVFAEYAANVQRSAEQAYRTLGTSESEYLATANKMGALFQGSGLSVQRSMELTTSAMQRAADMASVMGIDTSAAMEAVSGAAKGNYTMMDNLGVAMNATTLEAYAMSQGIETAWKEMDNAQKAEVAMSYFFERTSQYAGNFEREARETITGSIGMLQSSVESWVAGLGNSEADIKVLTANVLDSFEAVVQNVQPVVENLISTLPEAARTALPVVMDLLPDLLRVATDLFTETVSMVISMLPELVPVAVDAVFTFADALLQPDTLSLLLDAAIELTFALANGLIDALPVLIEKAPVIIVQFVDALIRSIPRLIAAGVNMIGAIIEGFISGVGGIGEATYQMEMNVYSIIRDMIDNAKDWGRDMMVSFANGIAERARAVWDNVTELAKGVYELIHFSEPDRGPLADFSTYAPDMVSTFARGILDSKTMLQRAVADTFDLEPYITAGAPAVNSRTVSMGGVTIQVYQQPGQDTEALTDTIMRRMQEVFDSEEAVFA